MFSSKAKRFTIRITADCRRANLWTKAWKKAGLYEKCFCPVAAIAAVAEHSIMRQFAAGRPDAEDERELAGFADRIFHIIDGKIVKIEDNRKNGEVETL